MTPKWKIETHDYDFSDVPKTELEACFLYEFARESQSAQRMVAQIRSLPKSTPPQPIDVASTAIQNIFLSILSNTSGFPSIAWQDLSESNRQSFLKLSSAIPEVKAIEARRSDPSPPLVFNFDPATSSLESAIQKYKQGFPAASNDPIKIGFIAVNLKFKDEALFIETFIRHLRSWLKDDPPREWTPVGKPTPIKLSRKRPRGRHSFWDSLNALGAMRLRSSCATFREAKAKMQCLQSKTNGLFYARRADFNHACEAGLRLFRELSDLFGSPHSELPIHHTKGWEK